MTHHPGAPAIDDVDDIPEPPSWWLDQAPPPPIDDVDDSDLAGWLDPLGDDGSAPLYYCTDPVEIIGDAPVMIIWQGKEWCCTVRGVERRDGTHRIPAGSLWDGAAIRKALALHRVEWRGFQGSAADRAARSFRKGILKGEQQHHRARLHHGFG